MPLGVAFNLPLSSLQYFLSNNFFIVAAYVEGLPIPSDFIKATNPCCVYRAGGFVLSSIKLGLLSFLSKLTATFALISGFGGEVKGFLSIFSNAASHPGEVRHLVSPSKGFGKPSVKASIFIEDHSELIIWLPINRAQINRYNFACELSIPPGNSTDGSVGRIASCAS